MNSPRLIADPTKEKTMPEVKAATDFDTRLAALDRAINYTHGREMSADDVVRIATQFDQYLVGSDAT